MDGGRASGLTPFLLVTRTIWTLVEEQGLRSFSHFFNRVVLLLPCVASKINTHGVCIHECRQYIPQKLMDSFSTAVTWGWREQHHHDLS